MGSHKRGNGQVMEDMPWSEPRSQKKAIIRGLRREWGPKIRRKKRGRRGVKRGEEG